MTQASVGYDLFACRAYPRALEARSCVCICDDIGRTSIGTPLTPTPEHTYWLPSCMRC
ncbi:hypothetical protein FIBSPDRAFT_215922 [Athelia psychrophila]|uniref:Uncharacterized protein n=1 Tax=Athelia psychrophila TaxID=1759441 RepID=A0A166SED7_9AGAM|nr:hypothetical protein FIBSPDRAFT_215922 [Fibularhizoctonia sp. CBS 109695]